VQVALIWPGMETVMVPPHAHMQVHSSVSAGAPPIITDVDPGVHGVVTGTHGIGVSTPMAAVVALATSGLAGDMHMPKVAMLAMGAQSVIVAAGSPPAVTM
jgi:hypothetical protein